MPLCCAVLHVKVLSCNEDGPVDGAKVTVTRHGVPPDEPDFVVVGETWTDDTGTATFIVGDEGSYIVTGNYNESEKVVTVDAVCGVNNVTVHFGITDKICFKARRVDNVPFTGIVEFTVTDDEDNVIGSCSPEDTGTSLSRCCVDIPGPGTYEITDDGIGGEYNHTVVVGEEDCGDKVVDVVYPGDAGTCERTIALELCGCPAGGITITVTLPGGSTVASSTSLIDGIATFEVPEGQCDEWDGSSYSVDLPGTTTNLTGTVSGDGMVISEIDPPGTWCDGHNDPCFGSGPETLTASFVAGWFGTPLTGSTTLTKIGAFTWQSGCMAYTSGNSVRFTLTLDPKITECAHNYSGSIVMDQYVGAGCTGAPLPAVFDLESSSASMCPVYGLFADIGNKEIEVTP